MKTIKFEIDSECRYCKEGLKYLKELEKRHPDCYASMNIKTHQYLPSLILRPDYNASGYLTHWHIEKEEKNENKKGKKNARVLEAGK